MNLGITSLEDVERTSLAKDISLVKPLKSLAVALTDLKVGGSSNVHPKLQKLDSQKAKIRDEVIDVRSLSTLGSTMNGRG